MRNLLEVVLYFFKLGCFGFGGPLSIISQIQNEAIQRRKWMSEEDYLQVISLIKSMPGPVAFQTVVFVARRRSNVLGATLAGFFFVLPSFLIMVLLARYYEQLNVNPIISTVLSGMQGGAFILILLALKDLGKPYYNNSRFWSYFLFSLLLLVFLVPEPIAIIGCGCLAAYFAQKPKTTTLKSVQLDLFLICFKAGAVAFGTGLSIVPLLQNDFVNIYKWVSQSQFLDALAFGQLTPGPVIITVTFIGYKVAGMLGAVIATTAVFLPSWFHMVTWFPKLQAWLSDQIWIKRFVLGASAALIAGICLALIHLLPNMQWMQLIVPLVFATTYRFQRVPGVLLVVVSGFGYLLLNKLFS